MLRKMKLALTFVLMLALSSVLLLGGRPLAHLADVTEAAATEAAATPEGDEIKTALFTIAVPEGWTYDASFVSDSATYAYASLKYEVDGAYLSASITANVTDVENYRNKLRSWGLDLKALAVGDVDQTYEVGGTTFYYHLDESNEYSAYNAPDQVGKTEMVARLESSGATYAIDGYTSSSSDQAPFVELLAGITLTAPEKNSTDPLWPWEGKAIEVSGSSEFDLGEVKGTATWVPFADCYFPIDTYNIKIAVYKDTLYVLESTKLSAYELKDGKWVAKEGYETKYFADRSYRAFSVDDQGNLYLSASYGKGLVLDPAGEELATINIEQNISMAPSGEFGYSYSYDKNVDKITNEDMSFATSTWVIKDLSNDNAEYDSVNQIDVTEDFTLVAADDKETENARFAVYTHDGELLHKFGADDYSDDEGSMAR